MPQGNTALLPPAPSPWGLARPTGHERCQCQALTTSPGAVPDRTTGCGWWQRPLHQAYDERDGRLLIFSDQRWWRNLRDGVPVTVRLRGRDVQGWAKVIEDPDVVARAAHRFIAARGARSARMINVRIDPGRMPTEAEVAARTRSHVVVAIAPR